MTRVAVSALYAMLEAGRKPPSAIFITVASGSVPEARALSLSPAFFLASTSGNRSRACRSRSARARAGGGVTPGRGGRVVVQFLLQPGHLVLRFAETFRQGGPAVEGGGPRAGANA